jgi:hypothetical protein
MCTAIAVVAISAQPKTSESLPAVNPETIRDLAVRIKTDNVRGAGTDNTVYFDIGPFAWKLNKPHHNDFEKGSEDTYELVHNGRLVDSPEQAVALTTADVLWLRLHKKGIGGVTGTGDGFGGAWHVAAISLIVNGVEAKPIVVNTTLNSRCWYWRLKDPDNSDLKTFARSLRMVQNAELRVIDKVTGVVTTNLFKRRRISGWLWNPTEKECGSDSRNPVPLKLPPVCVTGQVMAHGQSTDGLETIDLTVATIEAADSNANWFPQKVMLTPTEGFLQARYIRVESAHAHGRVSGGNVARICGRLRWDTDHEGWWEIHPRNSDDVQVLSR